MGWSGTPTTMLSQWLMGMSTRTALLWQTAAAMAGVISPSSESAMTMPMGPTMMSPAAVDYHGIFAGGGAVCARLEHGRSRDAVGSHGGQLDVRASGGKRRRQLTAKTAALPVND